MTTKILGISGSGSKRSFNKSLLDTARELVPGNATLETHDVSSLPLFNKDLEYEMPAVVREFKKRIREANAILIATPEYNFSISAVLKNALEWGNRPEDDNSWEGKPAAIMSASTSPRGGVRAQLHLRQIMLDLDMYPINRPQLMVGNAQEKFDVNLKLTDTPTRETLRDLLVSLIEWTQKLQANPGTNHS